MKKVLIGALAVVLALSFPLVNGTEAEAANLIGCKMKNTTVLWNDATSNATYRSSATSAVAAWNASTKVTFKKVSSGANLTLASGNFGKTGFDGIMKSATSLSAPGCKSGAWASTAYAWVNTSYTDSYVTAAKTSVFSHEIGHALGLAHRNTGPCASMSVMHGSSQARFAECKISTPRADDIAGINKLY